MAGSGATHSMSVPVKFLLTTMHIPTPPTSRCLAFVRPAWFGLFWRWEIRRTPTSVPSQCGIGFTRAAAVRQAYSWATASL